jgi:hypothetical protein
LGGQSSISGSYEAVMKSQAEREQERESERKRTTSSVYRGVG